jgi:hypothetical protein
LTISIVIPTVDGREKSLARCLAAYESTTPVEVQYLVFRNRPTCGIAWNEGIAQADGDFIHLSADDLEPQPGWYEAAWSKVNAGFLPAPRILKPDGSTESCGWDASEREDGQIAEFSRIPFAPKEWFWEMGPMLETHYMNDYFFGDLGRKIGIQTVIAREYLFVHHHEEVGRLDRLDEDWHAYNRALRKLT